MCICWQHTRCFFWQKNHSFSSFLQHHFLQQNFYQVLKAARKDEWTTPCRLSCHTFWLFFEIFLLFPKNLFWFNRHFSPTIFSQAWKANYPNFELSRKSTHMCQNLNTIRSLEDLKSRVAPLYQSYCMFLLFDYLLKFCRVSKNVLTLISGPQYFDYWEILDIPRKWHDSGYRGIWFIYFHIYIFGHKYM